MDWEKRSEYNIGDHFILWKVGYEPRAYSDQYGIYHAAEKVQDGFVAFQELR